MNCKFSLLIVLSIIYASCYRDKHLIQVVLPPSPAELLPGAVPIKSNIIIKNLISCDKLSSCFIIGLGSGAEGFQSVMISRNGEIQVVFRPSQVSGLDHYLEARLKTDNETSINFLNSIWVKKFYSISESFKADVRDGLQGFVYIETEGGGKLIEYDNYFPDHFRGAWDKLRSLVESCSGNGLTIVGAADGFDVEKDLQQRYSGNQYQ